MSRSIGCAAQALLGALWLALAPPAAVAGMAERGHRSQVEGIDLVSYPTQVKQVVVLVGALPAGDALAPPENIAVPTLTGMMLDRGTRRLDKFQIAERLENVGAQLSFSVGPQSLEIHGRCLRKDLPLLLELLALELREPAFKADEFEKARRQFIGALQDERQSTEPRAQEAFGRAIFPQGHPNRPHSIDEYFAAAHAATIEQLKSFHARSYGPAHLTLILVGDLDPAAAAAEVRRRFKGWSGGRDYLRAATPASAGAATTVTVPLKDKTSVSVLLGQPTGLRYRDPDALALRVGTAILGHGFTGRLMGTVRDREGLTYSIGAAVAEDTIADGDWYIAASFAPALLERGVASTRRVLETWWRDGVTESELETRKRGLVGGYLVGLSTTTGLAGTILTDLERGYGLDWLDRYPQAIESLTREEVNAAIHTHLDPSRMVLVEAGSLPGADGATGTDGAAPEPPAR